MTVISSNLYAGGLTDLQKFVQYEALGIFKANLVMQEYGTIVDLPQGTQNYQFSVEKDIDINIGNCKLQEGTTPAGKDNQFTAINIAVDQYGDYIKFSDVSLKQSPIDFVAKTARQLGEKLARVHDVAIQNGIKTGSNVLYGGAAKKRDDVDTSMNVTFALLSKIATLMNGFYVPTFGGSYTAVMHPKMIYDLFSDTGSVQAGIKSIVGTGGNQEAFNLVKAREIGTFYGVKIIESNNIQPFSKAGKGGVDVYPVYIIGQDGYGVVNGQPLTTYIDMPISSDSDPIAQRGRIAGKFQTNAKILKDSAIWRLEVGASLDAPATAMAANVAKEMKQ